MTVRLGSVATWVRGINFKPDDVVAPEDPGAVACMRTKNVQTDLDLGDVWGVDASFVRRSEQYLKEGDILVSSANSWNLVGKCSWVPSLPWRTTFGGFVGVLRADPSKVDVRYLYRWFSSNRTQALLRSFGQKTTSISNLNVDRCLAMDLPLPPLEEQRRISAALDAADALRTKCRESLCKLEALPQAIFVEMFGGVATYQSLGTLLADAELFTDGDWVESKDQDPAGEVRLTQLADVGTGRWLDRSARFMTYATATRLKCSFLAPGDVLVARMPDPIGRACVFPGDDKPAVTVVDVCVIRPNLNRLAPRWLVECLNTPKTRRQVEQLAAGTTRSRVSRGNLSKVELPVATLATQKLFAERVRQVDRQVSLMEISLGRLDALFASLQHRAFRGEL